MSDGRKRILSPFSGCKKWKAWNKAREKYMSLKRRKNLAESDRGSYYKETAKVHFTMVMKVITMMRVIMNIMNSSSYRRVLPIVSTKQFHQFLYKN